MARTSHSRRVPGARLEIYLPWRGFNDNASPFYTISPQAFTLASTVHPARDRLSGAAKKLHARNCYQVLGADLATPSLFVVCWTPDGCESERMRSPRTGGTGTAIVVAERYAIPVFNLARPGRRATLAKYLESLDVQLTNRVLQPDQVSLL